MRGVVFHWPVVALRGSFAGHAGYSIFGIIVVVRFQRHAFLVRWVVPLVTYVDGSIGEPHPKIYIGLSRSSGTRPVPLFPS